MLLVNREEDVVHSFRVLEIEIEGREGCMEGNNKSKQKERKSIINERKRIERKYAMIFGNSWELALTGRYGHQCLWGPPSEPYQTYQ